MNPFGVFHEKKGRSGGMPGNLRPQVEGGNTHSREDPKVLL